MKKENRYYFNIVIGLFITTFIASIIISYRTLETDKLLAPAGVVIYPLVYFLSTIYFKKFGKKETFDLILNAMVALIFFGLLLLIANAITVGDYVDGFESLFNVDFRMLIAAVLSFFVGLNINLSIFSMLKVSRKSNFLVSGIIGISVDSFIFIVLSFFGRVTAKTLLLLISSQFIVSILIISALALLFANIVPDTFAPPIRIDFDDK